ncbi:unnamed protein product [Adineta ricciae]|uniref:Uncharacterized protein n=1 Tax=Adineta ricciae TaxID=249248 RepID=A0A816BH77_ADIRI|nr:unnamed protein product [Adineta ricciae]
MYPQLSSTRQFIYQPIINSNLTHAILCNQNSGHQLHIGLPPATPKHHTYKDKQPAPSPHLKGTHKIKNTTKPIKNSEALPNNAGLPPKPRTVSRRQGRLRRTSSFENNASQHLTPLPNSLSAGNVHDRMQSERRSHTMAPLTRIAGPSSSPRAKLFASATAPMDMHVPQSSAVTTQGIISTRTSVCSRGSDVDTIDDDATVIVRVRYDPDIAPPPSEEAVREAINNQLMQRTGPNRKKEPIIIDFMRQNIQPNIPVRPPQPSFNRSVLPFQQRPSLRIPIAPQQLRLQQNPFPLPRPTRAPPHMPSGLPIQRLQQNTYIRPVQPVPLIRQQTFPFRPPLNRPQNTLKPPLPALSPLRLIPPQPTGSSNFGSPNSIMSSDSQSSSLNAQQNSSRQLQVGSVSNGIYRPSPITDVPELSKESLLNMLNQIPDLQGRQFNIEYAPPSAPEEYPIPTSLPTGDTSYPEPVVIDKLPNNVIQHVKLSNNPAITAALEDTIRREQPGPSSTLNNPAATVMHHSAQLQDQVQQSRPASSNESESSTEVSSSGSTSSSSSSSEESEVEEVKIVS